MVAAWPGRLAATVVPGARAGRAQPRAVRHRAAVWKAPRRSWQRPRVELERSLPRRTAGGSRTPRTSHAGSGRRTECCRATGDASLPNSLADHRLPARRTSPAVRSRHCSCSRHSETHTDSHRPDRWRKHVPSRTRSRNGATVLALALAVVLLGGCASAPLKPQTAADKSTPPKLGACYVLTPKDTERAEQRRRAGPLHQAAHRGDLRDRHPPGIDRQGLRLDGARQVGVRQVREVVREVPRRRREPRDARSS